MPPTHFFLFHRFASPTLFRLILSILVLSSALFAQTPKETNPPSSVSTKPIPTPAAEEHHELTAADVSAFLDGLVPLQLKRENIAGATISIVKDGQVLFEKGYGYSDVAKRTPVTPDTMFRPGSISKLFTWTSVMQLVEQGKLDLDRNVNDYLDYRIPDTYPQPITLRHLMTHTPGFEETDKDLIFTNAANNLTLRAYLVAHVPRRIFPPGQVPAYSNYGAALAGYIVERVSARPFADYVSEFILKPLHMTHSTFVQPLPADLQPLMSQGYDLASDSPKDYELIPALPAGSMAVSADDMTRFMIAHLQNGRYGDAQILRTETAQLMHSQQRTSNPRMPGMALGFYEENRNGLRVIGHGGDSQWFHSDLHLIPEANLGFFVSYNSSGKQDAHARGLLWLQFMDRYFPFQAPVVNLPTAEADAKAVQGEYMTSRRCDSCLLRLTSMLDEITVSSKADHTIQLDPITAASGQPRKWKEVGPLLFRDIDSNDLIAFNRGDRGGMQLVIVPNVFVMERVPWYQTKTFTLIVFVVTLSGLCLTLLLWFIAAMVRRYYGQTLAVPSPGLRIAVFIAVGLDLTVLALWVLFFVRGSSDLSILGRGSDGWLHALQVLSSLGIAASLVPLYAALKAWMGSRTTWLQRVLATTVALACAGYIWIVIAGRLLDWTLRY